MKLLLDTHIWVWSLLSPENLSEQVVNELESDKNEVWLSPISVWETMILAEKKRIALEMPIDVWLKKALRETPVQEAPLTHEIAIKSRTVALPHQDPADRFIVSTAIVYNLTLVTADKNIVSLTDISCLANN